MLTVEDLKAALPKNLQVNATQEYADKVNLIAADPDFAREVRNNFMTYSRVLTEAKYRTDDYLHAVMYCTFKLMGFTNQNAYIRTFPDRYTAMRARGATDRDISSFVAAYHKNQLVNRILEQAHIPMWLVNQDVMQKAINIQLEIAMTSKSDMARTAAANSLLIALKQPESKKVELDINLKNGGGLNDLRESMAELVTKQQELIAQGAAAKTVGRFAIGTKEDVIDVDVKAALAPMVKAAQPATLAALNEAVTGNGGTGVVRVEYDSQKQEVVATHVPYADTREPMPERPSLFAQPLESQMPVPTKPEDIKSPAVNYARCCDRAIEDCECIECDPIYLPTTADVPAPRRVSLFDDAADMP